MKGRTLFLCLLFLLVSAVLLQVPLAGHTRIELTDAGTGRKILSRVLKDGEKVLMTWKNSLFGLHVREVFQAQDGVLILTAVTFADPQGSAPPKVRPEDVKDLYHTGGAFEAAGLGKPFERMTYRVGDIGDPRLMVRGSEIAFKQEVGFGGSVTLVASGARAFEILLEKLSP